MSMPKLPFAEMMRACEGNAGSMVYAARNSRSKCLRASKPFPKIDFDGDEERALWEASANYVWRMLCFDFAASRPHSCIPCTADFDIAIVLRFVLIALFVSLVLWLICGWRVVAII